MPITAAMEYESLHAMKWVLATVFLRRIVKDVCECLSHVTSALLFGEERRERTKQ